MAQQTRFHEKAKITDNPETQLSSADKQMRDSLRPNMARLLLAALFCLMLSLHALAQVRTEIIPVANKLTCNSGRDDYNLFVVKADMPAQPVAGVNVSAYALGVALAPSGAGEVRVFALYWFISDDAASGREPLIKRDDDTGKLGKQLVDFKQSALGDNVATFFKGCAPNQVVPAVTFLLTPLNPQLSVDEIANAFRSVNLELKTDAVKSGQQDIDKPLTSGEPAQLQFAQTVRELLEKQLGKVTPPPPPGDGPKTGPSESETKLSTDLAEAQQKLETANKDYKWLSNLFSILLGVVITGLVLALAVIAIIYFSPDLKRRIFSSPATEAAIRRQTVNEMYGAFRYFGEPTAAQQKLDEIMNRYEQLSNEANGNPLKFISIYNDLQTEMKRFSLSLPAYQDDEKKNKQQDNSPDLGAVSQFISDNFGLPYVKPDLKEGLEQLVVELNNNLGPVVSVGGRDSKIPDRLQTTRKQVEAMWSKSSSEPCPEGALITLTEKWASFQKTLEPFKRISTQDDPLSHAQASGALYEYLWEKFAFVPQSSGDLKTKVERFFKDLEDIVIKRVPNSASNNASPDYILQELRAHLGKNADDLAAFKLLNRDIATLKAELPQNGDEGSAPLLQATQMAKDHKMVLSLLSDYRPSSESSDIVKTAESLSHKIKSATNAIEAVLSSASGTIDVRVSSLINELNLNKKLAGRAGEFEGEAERLKGELEKAQAEAKDSTELAGALSRYVNLSSEDNFDAEQARQVLARFNAGESTHHQLRLRLSAAVPALEQAIEEVRHAGREDALDALRISDFKEQLRGLLTKMEDFAGNALWQNCLYPGFLEQWMHNLLRAELLARTYFADGEILARLIDPLTQASEALRATISSLKVHIPSIRLLSKPPEGPKVDYNVDPKLRELQEVKRKVQALLRAQTDREDGWEFIVDVGSFPFQPENSDAFAGRVIKVAPGGWQ